MFPFDATVANTALCLLVAVISLTSCRSKAAMTQLHLEARTFVM